MRARKPFPTCLEQQIFISVLPWTSDYLLILGVEVIVAFDHTQ